MHTPYILANNAVAGTIVNAQRKIAVSLSGAELTLWLLIFV
jgi:hypothetical protein